MEINQILNPQHGEPARSGLKATNCTSAECGFAEIHKTTVLERSTSVESTETCTTSASLMVNTSTSSSKHTSHSSKVVITATKTSESLSRKAAPSAVERTPGSWTENEYKILIKFRQYGWSWEQISDFLPGRSAEACCKRWRMSHIIAPRSHPRWVSEEEDILVSLRDRGRDWSEIANFLPARTPDGCKNRWYEKHRQTLQKLKSRDNAALTNNLCRTLSSRIERPSSHTYRRALGKASPTANPAVKINPLHQTHTKSGYHAGNHLRRIAPKPGSGGELPRTPTVPAVQAFPTRLIDIGHLGADHECQYHLPIQLRRIQNRS